MTNLIKQAKLTISEMKAKGEDVGYDWFSKKNMAFFNTIVETQPNMANLFITSEKIEDWHKRKYTLRWYNHENHYIETIGEFMGYMSLDDARKVRKIYTQLYKDSGLTPLVGKEVLES